MIGSTLSHYRILAPLGEGGMGVVYKAQDTVLERVVALKVMQSDWLADASSRARFLQEARSAAALHHPHIATIFEANEADGVLFIAMEYIDGQSLRARMSTPLSPDVAVQIATDIAEGLNHAHTHGVVHRDLKPENVLLTPDGRAKILDFGLAKLRRPETTQAPGATTAARTETAIASLTQHGQIMGTPAYMSPEQARGLNVDFRSDLFSFGALFYEMIAGEAPFHGPTAIDTLSQVLHAQPPALVTRNQRLPAGFDRIASRCLEKEPQARYATTQELVDDLRALDVRPAAGRTVAMRRARRSMRGRRLMGGVAAAAILAAGAALWAWKPWARAGGSDGSAARAADPAPGGAAALPNWILVCDFDGNVGRDIMVATRELVTASLSQSRIVTPLGRGQIQRGLRLADRPDSTHITGDIARELAVRAAASAYIEGRVDKILTGYSIVLNTIAAETGNPLSTLSATAKNDAAVITTLDSLGLELRQKLGEEARVVKRTQPLRETYTSSFDAYRSYVAAMEMQRKGSYQRSNTLLRQALGMDPAFASAYIHVGTNYYNLGYLDSAQVAFDIARNHQEHLTEAERLAWQFFVAYVVDYDLDAALAVSDQQLRLPQVGADAHNNRAAILFDLGRYEDALQALDAAVRASPFGAPSHALLNQQQILLQTGAFDRAREVERSLTGASAALASLARAVGESNWAAADSLTQALQGETVPARYRYQSRLVAASLLAERGAVQDAARELAAAAKAAPNAFWGDLARIACLQLHIMAQEPFDARALGTSNDSTATAVVTGIAAAVRGDRDAAQSALATFRTRPAPERRRFAVDGTLLEAAIAAIPAGGTGAGSDAATVTGLLEPLVNSGRGPWICGRIPLRWLLAATLEQSGRLDDAARAYESVLSPERLHQDVWTWRAAAVPFAHAQLVTVYAQLGRPDDARRHLDALQARWTRPDPVATRILDGARATAGGLPQ